MGCHCLQVTMQLPNMSDARYLYDQLAVLCPYFLAITSATPVQKGLLADSDVRWLTIAASVDDRQRAEVPRFIKSRYDSVSLFISDRAANLALFNDEHVEVNSDMFRRLIHGEVDAVLATHIAHLFIRDPLVMYDKMIDIDDATRNEHFENIQSTNWQTVRFKPPSARADDPIGWRVEFRVMDVMPTPFENGAFSVFTVLLTKAIQKYGCVFYTRMTVVDENMGRAHKRNPCSEKYVVRKDFFSTLPTANADEFTELDVNGIFNGVEGVYFGLIPLVKRYLAELPSDSSTAEQMLQLFTYLEFISMRAAGEIPTTAQYLRRFVTSHADYQQDSRVSETISYDMVQLCHGLSSGTVQDDTFLPMKEFAARASRAMGGSKRPRE
jgi:glutamate--cysteine ligase catalytic subunit